MKNQNEPSVGTMFDTEVSLSTSYSRTSLHDLRRCYFESSDSNDLQSDPIDIVADFIQWCFDPERTL